MIILIYERFLPNIIIFKECIKTINNLICSNPINEIIGMNLPSHVLYSFVLLEVICETENNFQSQDL